MTSRRQFLGAAAAVAGLSSSASSAAATSRSENEEDFPNMTAGFFADRSYESASLDVRPIIYTDDVDWAAEFDIEMYLFHATVALDTAALRELIREIQPSRGGRRKQKIESGNIELALGDAMDFTDAETVVYGYPDGTKMRVGLEMRHEYGVHSLSFTDAEAVTFRDKLQEALDDE